MEEAVGWERAVIRYGVRKEARLGRRVVVGMYSPEQARETGGCGGSG